MNTPIVLQSYCGDFNKSPVLQHLVQEGSEWSTPGVNVLQGKIHKKKSKLTGLINDLGEYGPILDLVIRSTIPEMIVLKFSVNPGQITEVNNGHLHRSLLKKIRQLQSNETEIFTDLIGRWFSNKLNVRDYNTAYREKRSEILQNQVSHLVYCPYFIVS